MQPVKILNPKTGKALAVDDTDNVLPVIEYTHHEIHEGNFFTCYYVDADFDIADTVSLLISVAEKPAHMTFLVRAGKDTTVTLYEGVTHTALVEQTMTCNNRVRATVPTTRISTRNSDGSDGTAIWSTTFGIGANPTVARTEDSRDQNEWVLRPNTKYQLVVSTGTDNSSLSIQIHWYEEDTK